MKNIKFELRPRSEVRMHNLSIPMLEEEKNIIREKAARYGMTMASYARWALLKNAKED